MKKIIFLLVVFTLFFLFLIFISLFIVRRINGKGAIQVTSNPESKIYLNDKYLGQTPYPRTDGQNVFPSGDYTIKLVPLDTAFPEYKEKITLTNNTLTAVDRVFGPEGKGSGSVISVSAVPEKNEVQVLVVSFPDKAEVYMDSNLIGVTPLLMKNLSASDHKVKLKKSGYREKTVPIRTYAGYKVTVIGTLGIGQDPLPTPTPAPQVSLTPTPTATPASQITILQTPTGFLRVRDSNSSTANEVGRVLPGETYVPLQTIDGWYRIKLKDGKEGWVSAEFVKEG